jgi:hypothetical protein
MTNPAPLVPLASIGIWAWRLLALFALIAATAFWNAWSTAEENELTIRTALETRAAEWKFVKRITGKTLGK